MKHIVKAAVFRRGLLLYRHVNADRLLRVVRSEPGRSTEWYAGVLLVSYADIVAWYRELINRGLLDPDRKWQVVKNEHASTV